MSEIPRDPMTELVEEYALGTLDEGQRAAFENRLRHDVVLQRELTATMEALGALAFSTPVMPAPELKDRVMAQVNGSGKSRRTDVLPFAAPRKSRLPVWLGAALAASLVLAAGLARALRDAREESRDAHLMNATQSRVLAQRDSLIAQLTDPATELVTLATTGQAKPILKAYVNRARRTLMLSAALLETLPAGRAYQLWFIVDGKPVPSITFRSDSTGHAFVNAVPMPAGAVAAAAITQEPEGGSPAPTSPVLFVGKLATE